MRFVTQTQSQGEMLGCSPRILGETCPDVRTLGPSAGGETAAIGAREIQEEVGLAVSSGGSDTATGFRRRRSAEVRLENQAAQFAAVAGVKCLDGVEQVFAAKLEGVTAAGPGDSFIELPYLGIKILSDAAVPEIGERTGADRRRRTSIEPQLQ